MHEMFLAPRSPLSINRANTSYVAVNDSATVDIDLAQEVRDSPRFAIGAPVTIPAIQHGTSQGT